MIVHEKAELSCYDINQDIFNEKENVFLKRVNFCKEFTVQIMQSAKENVYFVHEQRLGKEKTTVKSSLQLQVHKGFSKT